MQAANAAMAQSCVTCEQGVIIVMVSRALSMCETVRSYSKSVLCASSYFIAKTNSIKIRTEYHSIQYRSWKDYLLISGLKNVYIGSTLEYTM